MQLDRQHRMTPLQRIRHALFSLSVGLTLASGSVRAEDLPSASDRDWKLEIRARQAIHDSTQFQAFNPGVTVQNGIATVFGNLPSRSLSDELIATLKNINGIRDVQSRIRIVPPKDDLPDRIALAIRTGQPLDLGDQRIPTKEPTVIVQNPPKVVPVNPTSNQRENITVLKTEVMDIPMIESTLRRAKQRDLRYADITWRFDAGMIYLGGSVEIMQDAFDLAARLSDFPGVKRVLLNDVRKK